MRLLVSASSFTYLLPWLLSAIFLGIGNTGLGVQAWTPISQRSGVRGRTNRSPQQTTRIDRIVIKQRKHYSSLTVSAVDDEGDDGKRNPQSLPGPSLPPPPSRLPAAKADAVMAAWNDQCDMLPIASLEDRMKIIGTYLGESGRRLIVECSKTAMKSKIRNEITDPFFKDFIKYTNSVLVASDDLVSNKAKSSGPGDQSSSSSTEKSTTPMAFKDRCIEWYRQKMDTQENPPEAIMKLFSSDVKLLERVPAEAFNSFWFNNKDTAQEFIKLVKSASSNEYASVSKLVAAETEVAFRSDYVDSRNAVDDFIGYITDCHTEYQNNTSKYIAPYVSLCQSSGYGKSRLLQQVAEKRKKLLYVCVGDSKSSFPGPNAKARNFLFLADRSSDERKRQIHLQEQLERCVSWCLQNDFANVDQFGIIPAAFWDDIVHHKTSKLDPSWEKEDAIWIAFDEARSLLQDSDGRLSDFRILRRALSAVSGRVRNRIFVILVDTKSTISNYSPTRSSAMDASSRPDPGNNDAVMYLFHPYILLLTHDVLKRAEVDFTDEWSFVNCGRPLWKSLYPDPSTSNEKLYGYAANKLRMSQTQIINNELALLAITICRTGVYISPQSSLASDLAANYMATLLLGDCTHERFLVTYLSDPVLTIVSAQLWYENHLLVSRGLPLLRQKLLHGAVREGYMGELVARMILLIGMDKTANGGSYDGKWCKVSSFMEHCFGITDCMVEDEAYMGFSHFIPYIQEPKTYQDLKDLLYRRGACCLPLGFEGVDLLIPFWRKTDREPVVSYISIQVKNTVWPDVDIELRDKMSPEPCFAKDSELRAPTTDIIWIDMQLGLKYKTFHPQDSRLVDIAQNGNGKPSSDSHVGKWKQWVYSVRGITPESYPFLRDQDRLTDELVRLAKGSLDLQEWMSCDEKLNEPGTSPGMARRRDHIAQIIP